MRIPLLLALGAVSLLVACSTTQTLTVAQTAEKVETECELAYVAIATTLNADEANNPAHKSQDEAIKAKAWADLQTVRAAYAAGQAISTAALLIDQQTAAKTTGATPATASALAPAS